MSGLPVISTDLPSIRGNLDDPEIIFFVPQKDPEAIAKALLELVKNPSKRKKMIDKGYDFVKKKLSEKKHYEQVEELINQYAHT
jgi:glycosyltransferase involved in cell wall biosynthesis